MVTDNVLLCVGIETKYNISLPNSLGCLKITLKSYANMSLISDMKLSISKLKYDYF